jgi:hypothetical protein
MIWWLIGAFWVGFLCGMFTMCMFVATRDRPYMDKVVTEESERAANNALKVSAGSHT